MEELLIEQAPVWNRYSDPEALFEYMLEGTNITPTIDLRGYDNINLWIEGKGYVIVDMFTMSDYGKKRTFYKKRKERIDGMTMIPYIQENNINRVQFDIKTMKGCKLEGVWITKSYNTKLKKMRELKPDL